MTVRSLAAFLPKAALEPHDFAFGDLAPADVEVEVECTAVCHSDLHLVDDDWGISKFPLVPGHEIVGRVARVGSSVSRVKVGTRVGIGWQRGSCGTCEWCASGFENLCQTAKKRTCVDQPGGLATHVRADARFVVEIPAEISSDDAAPLLCAGVTVHAPLARHIKRPGMSVAIVGLGGLGHLAVRFAHAMGAEVTAFDPVETKRDEALELGATTFATPDEADAFRRQGRAYDLILTTTYADLPWNDWLSLVKLNGTLCLTGVPSKPLSIHPDHLLDGQKTVTGSVIGSPSMQHAMMRFAAAQGVRPMIETLPMSRANEAFARLRRGQVRYRAVLRNDL